MLLYYIRHGDPIYDPDSLTPLGHRQAEAIGRRLAIYGLDEIYVSPSTRARLTAQPTCEILKKEPTVLPFVDESLAWADYGVTTASGRYTWGFNDIPTRTLMNAPEVRALGDEWYTHPALAGTRFERGVRWMREGVDDFFLSHGYRHDRAAHHYIPEAPNDKRIAIFAHQGAGLAFLSALLDIPYNTFCLHYDIGHTGMTVVNFAVIGGICIPQVLQHSGDGHLYHESLGTRYHNVIPI